MQRSIEAFSGRTLLDLIHWYSLLKLGRKKRSIGNKFLEIIGQSNLEEPSQLDNSKENAIHEALETLTNNTYVKDLEEGVEQITQFFTSKIRYLG